MGKYSFHIDLLNLSLDRCERRWALVWESGLIRIEKVLTVEFLVLS